MKRFIEREIRFTYDYAKDTYKVIELFFWRKSKKKFWERIIKIKSKDMRIISEYVEVMANKS